MWWIFVQESMLVKRKQDAWLQWCAPGGTYYEIYPRYSHKNVCLQDWMRKYLYGTHCIELVVYVVMDFIIFPVTENVSISVDFCTNFHCIVKPEKISHLKYAQNPCIWFVVLTANQLFSGWFSEWMHLLIPVIWDRLFFCLLHGFCYCYC